MKWTDNNGGDVGGEEGSEVFETGGAWMFSTTTFPWLLLLTDMSSI